MVTSIVGYLKDEVQKMIALGVIEPSKSEWFSPIVLMPKKALKHPH